jgi:hypothetical protein
MRVTNAKQTGRNENESTRVGKRAVLLALLVASTTTVNGQGELGEATRSPSINVVSTPQIVRRGAKPLPASSARVTAASPIFAVTPTLPNPSATVLLVSGDSNSADGGNVRLKNTQALVGLTAIGAPPQTANQIRVAPHPTAWAFPASPQSGESENIFAKHRQQGIVGRSGPEFQPAPFPLAIAPHIANPVPASSPPRPNFPAKPLAAEAISVSAADDSRVIPVTDAREDHHAITKTDPICFSLSDEPTEAALDRVPLSGLPTVSELAEGDETAHSVEAVENPAKPAGMPTKLLEPLVVAAEAFDEKATGRLSVPTTESVATEKIGSEKFGDGFGAEPMPLAAVDTTVKLAPVLTFAHRTPALKVAEPVGRSDAAPDDFSPDDFALDDDAIENEVSMESTQRVDPSVHERAANVAIEAAAARSDSDGPDVDNRTMPESFPTVATRGKRQAIAVETPPIMIQRRDSLDSVIRPAVNGVIDAPSTAPALAQNPPSKAGESDEAERKKTLDQTVNEPNVARVTQDLHASFAEVAPRPLTTRQALPQLPTVPPVSAPQEDARLPEGQTEFLAKSMQLSSPAGPPNANQEPRVENDPATGKTGTPARLASSSHHFRRRVLDQPTASSTEVSPAATAAEKAAETQSRSQQPVVLQLSRAQVRSMTIGGRLRRVSIANTDICQAFASGSNQIKLIGTGVGRTELTIWADVNSGEPTRVQSFEIDVSDGVDATGDRVAEHTVLLNDSIAKAFPGASVVVSKRGRGLVVTGQCDSEATAKQIVRMVRKSCLVPVQDNVKVR